MARGFLEDILKRPIERLVVEPGRRLGEGIGSGIINLVGTEEQKRRAAEISSQPATIAGFNTRGVDGGAKQIVGEAAETASYLLPYKRVAGAVTNVIKPVLKKAAPIVGASVSLGSGGYLADAGADLQQNETVKKAATPGFGTAVSAALPPLGAAARNLGPNLVNSLIKPSSKSFGYGKNPGATVAELGIVANSLDELTTKVSSVKDNVGQTLSRLATKVAPGTKIDATDITSPFDEAIEKATANNNQALLNRLTEARDAVTQIFTNTKGVITPVGSRILNNLDYVQGLELKRRVGGLNKWTGQQTDDETVNGALSRAYGLLKGKLDEAAETADPESAAELRKLNNWYANLTEAEAAAKHRATIEARQNMINLPGKIGVAGALLTAPMTGGASILYGIGAVALDKALSTPAVKTRLAKMLSGASRQELEVLRTQNPTVFERLQQEFGDLYQSGVNAIKPRVIPAITADPAINQPSPPNANNAPTTSSNVPQSIEGNVAPSFESDNQVIPSQSSMPASFVPDEPESFIDMPASFVPDGQPVSSSESSSGRIATGKIVIPKSSRLAYTLNNPGNLKFVGQPGAVKGEKGFAKFKTPEAGYEALKRQIALDTKRGLSVGQFVNKYAPSTENDTKLYVAQAAKALGASPNTKLSELSPAKVAAFVAKKESSTKVA